MGRSFGSSHPSKCSGCRYLKSKQRYTTKRRNLSPGELNYRPYHTYEEYQARDGSEYECTYGYGTECAKDGSGGTSTRNHGSGGGGLIWGIVKFVVVILLILAVLHATPLWDVLKSFIPFLA